MRDYREKLVNGWLTDGKDFGFIPVRIRMTNDEKGKSLSLTTEMNEKDMGIQIGIPLEEVKEIINVAKKENKK